MYARNVSGCISDTLANKSGAFEPNKKRNIENGAKLNSNPAR